MSKSFSQDVTRLISLVGGKDNIATVSHCLTRLRFGRCSSYVLVHDL